MTVTTTRRPPNDLESKAMSDERSLFIVSDDLPAMKRKIKRQADKEGISSTQLMIYALCAAFGLTAPVRAVRPARQAQDSTALSIVVPVELWQAVHNEVGARGTSKKEVVMSIFHDAFDKKRTKR